MGGRDRSHGRDATWAASLLPSHNRQESWQKMTADYGTSLLLDACLPRIDGRGFTKTA
jgi:hypothetical protein